MCARLIPLVFLSVLMTVPAAVVYAEDNPIQTAVTHVGVGGGITFVNPHSGDADRSTGASFVYLWHSFHSHWGPTFGFDWHSNDFNQPLGSSNAPLGSLTMRAVLAGVGGTQRFGKFSTSASFLAGYSFNDFSVASAAPPTFGSAGISLVGVSVDNCPVIKPTVAGWYDVASHVGVGLSAGYFVARPDRTMTTGFGSDTRTLRADAWELTAGVVFGLWKKH